MTVAHVQSAVNGSNASVVSTLAVTLGSTVGSGNTVIGIVGYNDDGATISSIVDDKGNSYTTYDLIRNTGATTLATAFILGNITNAPITLTVTTSIVVQFLLIAAGEYSGVIALADPRDGHTSSYQAAAGTGADLVSSGAITTTTAGDLIWGAFAQGGQGGTNAAGTGFTQRINTSATFNQISSTEDTVQGTAGSVPATFTQSIAGGTLTFVTALKSASATASGTPPGMNLNTSFA